LIYRGRASLRIAQASHGDTIATILIPLDKVTDESVPEEQKMDGTAASI